MYVICIYVCAGHGRAQNWRVRRTHWRKSRHIGLENACNCIYIHVNMHSYTYTHHIHMHMCACLHEHRSCHSYMILATYIHSYMQAYIRVLPSNHPWLAHTYMHITCVHIFQLPSINGPRNCLHIHAYIHTFQLPFINGPRNCLHTHAYIHTYMYTYIHSSFLSSMALVIA
jgi:hypothetical protein